ncbi:MAG: glutamate formimidoyltransferase [Acidobacteriota bacterium]|nr:glutamate formimidoyltransferase [Acidobacteriota bacterium]
MVEAVPNVSEGRRGEVIAELATVLGRGDSVRVLDVSSDAAHNRTVFSVAAPPTALRDALLDLFAAAIRHIDLRSHEGVHPRIGAVDVVPLIPLGSTSMTECVSLATKLATAVSHRFDLPVYLYEEAASDETRRRLERIRSGGLGGLTERIAQPGWRPDFGPARLHRSAGATVIGARGPLIAFNVNLNTPSLTVAQRIARRVRESNGGLPAVKAMGVATSSPEVMQVSMNLVDYRRTSLLRVFDAVREAATRHQVDIRNSEIVGLAPADALFEVAGSVLRLGDDAVDHVLESRLDEKMSSLWCQADPAARS